MAHGTTYKFLKLVGESSKDIEDAVQTALQRSGKSVHGHSWAHIVDLRANLAPDGTVQLWQATVEAAFEVDED